MAKLYLKFESSTLKELPLAQGAAITVGRLPDNQLQIDNLAVSGHHAKIYWDSSHFVVEDNESLNGTYVNNQRVTRQVLKDNDSILIGKHTVIFKDEWHAEDARGQAAAAAPPLPAMDATVVLDTKKAKEMLAQMRTGSAPRQAPAAATGPIEAPTHPLPMPAPVVSQPAASSPTASSAAVSGAKERTGTLSVLEGKTNEQYYLLSSKLTVIGGSKMASVKLKGSFFKSPPDVAAMVSRRDDKYYVSAQDKKANLRINGADVTHQQELTEGDVLEVCKVKMAFAYSE